MREHVGFGGAQDVEDGVGGVVDAVEGEGHAPRFFLGDVVGGDKGAFDLEGLCLWEEGGGVSVIAHAEHDEVKGLVLEDGAEFFFILFGVVLDLIFGDHAVDVMGCDEHFLKACLHGHAVVALRVGWGDGSFVAPEEVDFIPLDFFKVGWLAEELVELLWG